MDYQKELEQIRQSHGGILRPGDVVEYATDPETTLHGQFQWNDTEAAHQYRLWQARELIRVVVNLLPHSDEPTRVYVSLSHDRRREGGGYRTLDNVMRSKALRESLLRQAAADMERFETKYRQLTELASVISAMRVARKQTS